MPEISDSDFRAFVAYQNLGTPGEVAKKISDLEGDNKTQRDEIRDLKAKVPPEGSVVLDKQKAGALAEYEALGKPADLKGAVEKVGALESELAKRDRDAARSAAAKALGIEGADLAPFAGSDDLTYEVREREEGGKKIPVAFVKDAEGKEHELVTFGKEKWGRPFEAVLNAAKNGSGSGEGTTYTRMGGGSGSAGSATNDPIQARIDRMNKAERKNALLPQT